MAILKTWNYISSYTFREEIRFKHILYDFSMHEWVSHNNNEVATIRNGKQSHWGGINMFLFVSPILLLLNNFSLNTITRN